MLGQLVCIDRRYQRMNCFNIREVQSLLKRKFFIDLVNTHDYKNLIDKSVIGVKYRTNQNSYQISNTQVFFNFGLENVYKARNSSYFSNQNVFKTNNFFFLGIKNKLENLTIVEYFSKNYISLFTNLFIKTEQFKLKNFFSSSFSFSVQSFKSFINQFSLVVEIFFLNFATNLLVLSGNFLEVTTLLSDYDIKKISTFIEKSLFLGHYYKTPSVAVGNFKEATRVFLESYPIFGILEQALFRVTSLYIETLYTF